MFDSKSFTVSDVQEQRGVEYAPAYGFVQYLTAEKYIEATGEKRRSPEAKGKGPGATLFRFTEAIPEGIAQHLLTKK